MESIKKNKLLLSVFGITLVIFIYYMFFSGGSSSSSQPISNVINGPEAQSLAGQEILRLLAQLGTVQIDNSLFSTPSWTSLQNFQTPIPSNTPGKTDLFAGQSGSLQPVQTNNRR